MIGISTWIQSAPAGRTCSNVTCHAPIPAGLPAVSHRTSYGCYLCGIKYVVVWAGPFPDEWAHPDIEEYKKVARTIELVSFGFKYGCPEGNVYDVRKTIRNPWQNPKLRKLTGLDKEVQDFVGRCSGTKTLVDTLVRRFPYRTGPTFFIGCHGGRHRSVACAEIARRVLQEKYPDWSFVVRHRDLTKEGKG